MKSHLFIQLYRGLSKFKPTDDLLPNEWGQTKTMILKAHSAYFKCYKTYFTEDKVSLVTEIKGFFRFWSIPSGALVSTDTCFPPQEIQPNVFHILFTYTGNKGINQNKAWYCKAMRIFREWMWHPPPLFHTAVYFIYRQDGWRQCHWRQFTPFVREGEKRPFTSFSQGWFGKCFPISWKDLQNLAFKH